MMDRKEAEKEADEFVRDWMTGFPEKGVSFWRPFLMVVSVMFAYALLCWGCWLMRGNW